LTDKIRAAGKQERKTDYPACFSVARSLAIICIAAYLVKARKIVGNISGGAARNSVKRQIIPYTQKRKKIDETASGTG
jgi:hypothetical protein